LRAEQPSQSSTVSATIVVVSVGFKPAEPPPPPRLEHVRDLWQMHRPHDCSRQNWFAYFRFYQPTEAYFDRFWPLPDFEEI
jgi:hypothetical protein